MLSVCPSRVPARPPRGGVRPPLLILAVAGLLAGPVRAQVYASAPGDDMGEPLVLSNFASEQTPQLLIDAPPPAPRTAGAAAEPRTIDPRMIEARTADPRTPDTPTIVRAPGVPDGLLPWFRHVGREQALPVSLLLAVAAAESGFNPRARSPKGAQGLMQLMPATAREMGVRQVWSVGDNLRGGASYLRGLLQRFSGDLSLALAAYNAGEGAVQRAGNRIPDFEETRQYVPKVMAYQRHYAQHDAAKHDAAKHDTRPAKSSMTALKTAAASADAARIPTP